MEKLNSNIVTSIFVSTMTLEKLECISTWVCLIFLFCTIFLFVAQITFTCPYYKICGGYANLFYESDMYSLQIRKIFRLVKKNPIFQFSLDTSFRKTYIYIHVTVIRFKLWSSSVVCLWSIRDNIFSTERKSLS